MKNYIKKKQKIYCTIIEIEYNVVIVNMIRSKLLLSYFFMRFDIDDYWIIIRRL